MNTRRCFSTDTERQQQARSLSAAMIIDIDADQKSLNLVVQPQHSREREHTTAHIDSSTSVIRTRLSPPLYAAAISRVHWSHAPEWVNTKRISNVVCFQPDCFPCHLLTKRPSVSIPSNQQIQTIQKDPSSRLSHKKISSTFLRNFVKQNYTFSGSTPNGLFERKYQASSRWCFEEAVHRLSQIRL